MGFFDHFPWNENWTIDVNICAYARLESPDNEASCSGAKPSVPQHVRTRLTDFLPFRPCVSGGAERNSIWVSWFCKCGSACVRKGFWAAQSPPGQQSNTCVLHSPLICLPPLIVLIFVCCAASVCSASAVHVLTYSAQGSTAVVPATPLHHTALLCNVAPSYFALLCQSLPHFLPLCFAKLCIQHSMPYLAGLCPPPPPPTSSAPSSVAILCHIALLH